MNKLTISVGVPSDSLAYCELMKECFFGEWFEARFHWQYFSAGHSTLFVARQGNKPVGILGIERRSLNVGEPCVLVIDIAVAASWRRRGVLRQLEAAASAASVNAGAKAMLSFTNNSGALALSHMSGWQILAPITEMRRTVSQVFPINSIYQNVANSQTEFVTLLRDESYRDWRYAHHPLYKYHKLGTPNGLGAMIKVFYKENIIGDVLEVFGDTQNLMNLRNLERIYRTINEAFAELGASESITWGMVPVYERELLRRLGWEERPQHRNFAIKPLDRASRIVYDPNSWRLQPADIEHY
jgi:hypothetical protein